MRLLAAYKKRVRHRPDSEHGQALLRTVIVSLLLLNTAWVTAHDSGLSDALWVINVCSVVFSVVLFTRILQRPTPSVRRRVLGAIHDNAVATLWLYLCGAAGALALFIYPFVTVGNGFRFGVRYLALSGLLGAFGIGALLAAPGWDSHGMIGIGVLLSHVVVTVYTGVLLRHLRQTQAQLAEQATRDTLTGLPNRRLLKERLSDLLTAPDRGHLACLYLDLDGFKAVNDRCGHHIGDKLLNRVAQEIRGCIRPSDTLARLGGDEFTVIVGTPAGREDARLVADRIIDAIDSIRIVDGHDVDISVSIGISFVCADAAERPGRSEELLRAADEAMYAAKRSGKGRYEFAAPRELALAS
jgi:diguanylate cyclase (GGDEF)-like protein